LKDICFDNHLRFEPRKHENPSMHLQDKVDMQSEQAMRNRLIALNKPEWKHGIVGVIASAALGLQMPGKHHIFIGVE
jgi:single-stranded DNA-specific DHH superfamily exonuclease